MAENVAYYGLRPLYIRWSDSRQDTRTQVGNVWEPMYNGTEFLIGLIFPEPGDGLVPLYIRWSDSRQDTRTQVGNVWEPMYNGTQFPPIGWIRPPGRVVLEKIDYKLPNAIQMNVSKILKQTVLIDPKLKSGQTPSVTIGWEKTTSRSWHWDNSTEVSMKITAKVGIPGIGESDVEVGAANTFTVGESEENTVTESEEYTQPVNANPGETIEATLKVSHTKLTVPYEATFKVLDDYNKEVARWCSTGVYEGVDYSDIAFSYTAVTA